MKNLNVQYINAFKNSPYKLKSDFAKELQMHISALSPILNNKRNPDSITPHRQKVLSKYNTTLPKDGTQLDKYTQTLEKLVAAHEEKIAQLENKIARLEEEIPPPNRKPNINNKINFSRI